MFERFAVIGFLAFAFEVALCADQITFYTNQSDWNMAESVGTVNGPVTVSADPSAWTQSQGLYAGNPRDPEVIETSTLSNGVVFSIAAVEEYGLYPGNPIQFVGGGIDTNLNEDYSVIWTLSQPIYGFSGYFTTNVPPASQGADVGMGPSGAQVQTGFFGVSSNEPIGSLIYITDAGCPGTGSDQCSSIFNFTDLQFQFLPAPEPSYTPLLIALLALLVLAKLHHRKSMFSRLGVAVEIVINLSSAIFRQQI